MNPIYRLDQEVFRAIHVGMHREWLDPVMLVITDTGRGEVKFTLLLILCFLARYRPYASMALTSGIAAGVIGLLIKEFFITRDRPSTFDWANPIPSYIEVWSGHEAPRAANSFPSGHAVSSFAIAVALAWAFRKTEHAWIGWVVILWAALVGLSRVYVGVHFLSDALGGAAIGGAVGTLFYLWWKKKGWVGRETASD